jgi:dsRNA-specific ribonuclease
MEPVVQPNQALREFIIDETEDVEFEDFIHRLLSTFLPPNYLNIYMAKELRPRDPSRLPGNHEGILVKGPFYLFVKAFTHKYISEINLETIETLGDSIFNFAVVSFIFRNWPNLRAEKIVDNMKQFYTNNERQGVSYARQLHFPRWFRTDPILNASPNDLSDNFEAFVGALYMIGEFYIGDGIGQFVATEFSYKLLSLQEWHPESPEYYSISSTLFNDWLQAVDPKRSPVVQTTEKQNESNGMWIHNVVLTGEIITEMTNGTAILVAEGIGNNQATAKEMAYEMLVNSLKLNYKLISQMRENKWLKNPIIAHQLERLHSTPGYTNADVLRVERRENNMFSFIAVPVTENVGNGKTVTFLETRARGMSMATPTKPASEAEAITNAVEKLLNGAQYQVLVPVSGEAIDYSRIQGPTFAAAGPVRPGATLLNGPRGVMKGRAGTERDIRERKPKTGAPGAIKKSGGRPPRRTNGPK